MIIISELNLFIQVVFITEYMSSGSLRQFLRKTKRGSRTLKASFYFEESMV